MKQIIINHHQAHRSFKQVGHYVCSVLLNYSWPFPSELPLDQWGCQRCAWTRERPQPTADHPAGTHQRRCIKLGPDWPSASVHQTGWYPGGLRCIIRLRFLYLNTDWRQIRGAKCIAQDINSYLLKDWKIKVPFCCRVITICTFYIKKQSYKYQSAKAGLKIKKKLYAISSMF